MPPFPASQALTPTGQQTEVTLPVQGGALRIITDNPLAAGVLILTFLAGVAVGVGVARAA